MNDHDDNITDHWSHYDQLVKSKRIQKAFKNYPELEDKIVKMIKSDDIKAADIRDKLDVICGTDSKKPINLLLDSKSIDTVFQVAQSLGGDNDTLQLLTKFHETIAPSETKQAKDILNSNAAVRKQIEFKLLSIKTILSKWLRAAKKGTTKSEKEEKPELVEA